MKTVNAKIPTTCFVYALALVWAATTAMAAEKPNIVFFLTDDQGYGDLGCYGSKIQTPNIDKLRGQGMKFTDFYVHQRCSPTRLAFMTGSHAHRAGCTKVIYKRDRIGIHADEITTPELLRKAGYATGIVGKWHLGEWDAFNPTRHGFDFFYGFMVDEDDNTAIFRNRERLEKVKSKTDGAHTDKLLAAGVDFIKTNKEKPFFLYYASPLPHTKWLPNERFKGTSKQGTYGDVVREIDWQVGELMKALDAHGLRDNTLFIFASDNGPVLGIDGGSPGPLRDGKWTNFEGGVRVPCIMRWPGHIAPGSQNAQITGIIDLLPTFCTIAGVDMPSDRVIDGKNILPYMKGEALDQPIHESFIVLGSTIRYGQWKLLVKAQKPGGKQERWGDRKPAPAGTLFDVVKDPGETTDVSSQHPKVVENLSRRMDVAVKELAENTRPIGQVPGAPEPEKTKKRKRNK